MDFFLPELEVNMIVTTPYTTLLNITPNKRYVIERLEQDLCWVRDDQDKITSYKAINFIEADVYYALNLYITLMRILNLTNKPLNSLDR